VKDLKDFRKNPKKCLHAIKNKNAGILKYRRFIKLNFQFIFLKEVLVVAAAAVAVAFAPAFVVAFAVASVAFASSFVAAPFDIACIVQELQRL
jgi:hypothetical protein